MLIITKRQWPIIIGSFLASVCFSISVNVPRKLMIEAIPVTWLSFENLMCCLSAMFSSFFWDKIQEKFLKHYVILEILETIVLTIITVYFMFKWNARLYFLIDLFYYILIGSFLSRCTKVMQIKLFPIMQERINAENNFDFFIGIAGIIGYGIALFIILPLNVCLALFIIADWIRTAGIIYTVLTNKSYIYAKHSSSIPF